MSLPMAPDVLYLWQLLEPALQSRGLLTTEDARQTAQALAFAVAMERRAAVRLTELTSEGDRASAERLRATFRRRARAMASMLGLLPRERVDAAPIDPHGHDPELAEWFGLDPAAMAAAIRAALSLAKEESR